MPKPSERSGAVNIYLLLGRMPGRLVVPVKAIQFLALDRRARGHLIVPQVRCAGWVSMGVAGADHAGPTRLKASYWAPNRRAQVSAPRRKNGQTSPTMGFSHMVVVYSRSNGGAGRGTMPGRRRQTIRATRYTGIADLAALRPLITRWSAAATGAGATPGPRRRSSPRPTSTPSVPRGAGRLSQQQPEGRKVRHGVPVGANPLSRYGSDPTRRPGATRKNNALPTAAVRIRRGRAPDLPEKRHRVSVCRSPARPGTPPRFGGPQLARGPGWRPPGTRGRPCLAARPE